MKNKKKLILKFLKYGFLFLFFLYALMFSYNLFFGDTIVNYGFSYAISRGEVPYLDFNLIIPLFSPIIYLIPLIISKNFFVYYMFQSLLLVFLFCILEKLLDKKVYLLFALLFIGFPLCLFSAFFPGYNFILVSLIILLIYLEKKKSNHYLIGFIIGLMIITKHTIGIFFIIPSCIFYFKDFKVLMKRIIGVLIPGSIFFIFLIISGSLDEFFNLCVLGLFDFINNNYVGNNIFLIIVVGLFLLINLIIIFKDKKNIVNYYGLTSLLFIYPLLDDYHVSLYLLVIIILLLNKIDLKLPANIYIYSIFFALFMNIVFTVITFNLDFKLIDYPNYPKRLVNDGVIKKYNKLEEFDNKTSKRVVLLGIGTENYFYKITHNLEITYFDLTNYGNYGYNSYKMMTKKLDNLKDCFIIVDDFALNGSYNQQYYKELGLYVINNYKFCKDLGGYKIYYKE